MKKGLFKLGIFAMIAIMPLAFAGCKPSKKKTDDPYAQVYSDGPVVEGAGIDWAPDTFAATEHTIDESVATPIGANQIVTLMINNQIEANKVYVVEDTIQLYSDSTYNAKNAKIIANGGILIGGESSVKLTNLIAKGTISIRNSTAITLENVDVQGNDKAIQVAGQCENILIKSCRLISNSIALNIEGDGVALYKSYVTASQGVQITANDAIIQNSHIVATNNAIVGQGKGNIIRENLIEVPSDYTGISLKNSYNGLIALNVVKTSQKSIVVSDSFNCSAAFNSAIRIIATGNKNLYIVNNILGGRVIIENNNYLICDANTFATNATAYSKDNFNINGDNVTNVNARLGVGADKELLPHTNKDLFVGMERKDTIRDLDSNTNVGLRKYIQNHVKDKITIVPPGVYQTNANMTLGNYFNNVEIYAYGVMHEQADYGQTLYIGQADNIRIYGLTFGYAKQSAGQIHVIDKLGNNKLLVVPAAGYENKHVEPNGGFYDWFTKQADGSTTMYPIVSLSHTIYDNGNGTATMTITGDDVQEYKNIQVGDIITCRLYGSNNNSVAVTGSSNILFKDVVIYGYSNALAMAVLSGSKNVELERVHNTSRSAFIIDKATYDKYRAWEDKYNVDLEVYIDENGNYRGSIPRIGSVDATHVSRAENGLKVTSCYFDQMTDDGSNHRGSSSRLHKVVNNNDGTTSIYYKGSVAEYYYNAGNTISSCMNFVTGDSIFVYAYSSGKVLCDTKCLSDAEEVQQLNFSIGSKSYSTAIYKVNVPTKDVNFSAVTGIDLSDNHYSMTNKVLVDNISKNSTGLVFDNVLVENTRSRGILVKSRDAIIKNCTFHNLAHTGILMSIESIWGESSIAKNVNVQKCLFDHVGYVDRLTSHSTISPIYILGVGKDVANMDLACSNITIDGCKFINNEHDVAIGINSAQDVRIINNDFGYIKRNGEDAIGKAINILNSKNIFIENNKYVDRVLSLTAVIKGGNYMNIYGNDTLGADGKSLFPDDIK